MEKQFSITLSPFDAPIETFDGFSIMAFPPYDSQSVTLKIDANLTDYQNNMDQPGVDIRNLVEISGQSITHTLTLSAPNMQIWMGKYACTIQLQNVQKVNLEGQDFYRYDFLATRVESQPTGSIVLKLSKDKNPNILEVGGKDYRLVEPTPQCPLQIFTVANQLTVRLYPSDNGEITLEKTLSSDSIRDSYHIVVTWENNQVQIFINGELI